MKAQTPTPKNPWQLEVKKKNRFYYIQVYSPVYTEPRILFWCSMNLIHIGMLRTLVRIVPAAQLGYRITINILPQDQDVWESLTHEAMFSTHDEAQRLADALTEAEALNLGKWTWFPSASSSLEQFRAAPTAQLKEFPFVPDY